MDHKRPLILNTQDMKISITFPDEVRGDGQQQISLELRPVCIPNLKLALVHVRIEQFTISLLEKLN